jgi:hypothetical protein
VQAGTFKQLGSVRQYTFGLGMQTRSNRLFISYSSRDRDFVSTLAAELKSFGVEVWWDKWEMKVGDSINKKIQEGISSSGWLAIILSPNSVKSPWVERELNSALTRELESKEVFVLPILYQECEIPLFLKEKIYADFRGSFHDGIATLLARVVPPIDPAICARLLSEDVDEIRAAFFHVSSVRRTEYVAWLVSKLDSKVSEERRSAMMSLYVLRYEHLAQNLTKLAKDLSKSVRALAVFYIGELGVSSARGAVAELTQDGSPHVRAAARAALDKLGG